MEDWVIQLLHRHFKECTLLHCSAKRPPSLSVPTQTRTRLPRGSGFPFPTLKETEQALFSHHWKSMPSGPGPVGASGRSSHHKNTTILIPHRIRPRTRVVLFFRGNSHRDTILYGTACPKDFFYISFAQAVQTHHDQHSTGPTSCSVFCSDRLVFAVTHLDAFCRVPVDLSLALHVQG